MPDHKGIKLRLKIPTRVQPEVVPPPGRIGQYTNKIHHMKTYMLQDLRKKDFALPFMEPVDTKLLNVPTYYTIIENPMDMGTVMLRVQNNYYRSVKELLKDIRLVLSNCFKFNMPDSPVYRDGQELEKFLYKVLDTMPKGEEVLYDKEMSESLMIKHQCRLRLKTLQEASEQMEQDAQALFINKWLAVYEEVNKENIKSLKEFDIELDKILKNCHDHGRRILEAYDCAVVDVEADAAKEVKKPAYGTSSFICGKPPIDWQDCLIDVLDDTVNCLKQDLAKCRLGIEPTPKESYSTMLVPLLASAQTISEELSSCKPLSDSSSDEEELVPSTHKVSEEDRQFIRKEFSELAAFSMYDIMHLIEQAEFRCRSNVDRNYYMVDFKPQTISLIKKSISLYTKCKRTDDHKSQELGNGKPINENTGTDKPQASGNDKKIDAERAPRHNDHDHDDDQPVKKSKYSFSPQEKQNSANSLPLEDGDGITESRLPLTCEKNSCDSELNA